MRVFLASFRLFFQSQGKQEEGSNGGGGQAESGRSHSTTNKKKTFDGRGKKIVGATSDLSKSERFPLLLLLFINIQICFCFASTMSRSPTQHKRKEGQRKRGKTDLRYAALASFFSQT